MKLKSIRDVALEISRLLQKEYPLDCSSACMLAILFAYQRRSLAPDKRRNVPQYIVLNERDRIERMNFCAYFRQLCCNCAQGSNYTFHIFYKAYFPVGHHWYLIELNIRREDARILQFDSLSRHFSSFTEDLHRNLPLSEAYRLDYGKLQKTRYGCMGFVLDLSFKAGELLPLDNKALVAYAHRNTQIEDSLPDKRDMLGSYMFHRNEKTLRNHLTEHSNLFEDHDDFFNYSCSSKFRSWLMKTQGFLPMVSDVEWMQFVNSCIHSPIKGNSTAYNRSICTIL